MLGFLCVWEKYNYVVLLATNGVIIVCRKLLLILCCSNVKVEDEKLRRVRGYESATPLAILLSICCFWMMVCAVFMKCWDDYCSVGSEGLGLDSFKEGERRKLKYMSYGESLSSLSWRELLNWLFGTASLLLNVIRGLIEKITFLNGWAFGFGFEIIHGILVNFVHDINFCVACNASCVNHLGTWLEVTSGHYMFGFVPWICVHF